MRNETKKRFLHPGVVLFTALCSAGCFIPPPQRADTESPRLVYRIAWSPKRPHVANVTVDLPMFMDPTLFDLLPIPGKKQRTLSITDVRCGKRRVLPHPRGGWKVPAVCSELSYNVILQRFKGSYMASAQTAVFDVTERSWAFLPGGALFLMPRGKRMTAHVYIEGFKGPRYTRMQPLPKGGYAGLSTPFLGLHFLGLGEFKKKTVQAGPLKVRHLFASPPPFDLEELTGHHKGALSYLHKVMGAPKHRSMDVYWFPLDLKKRTLSGASGNRSLVVNFLTNLDGNAPKVPPCRKALRLMVLLHEQFHQLTAQAPLWLVESLAQYYAIKSLKESVAISGSVFKTLLEKMTSKAPRGVRLVDLQRMYEKTKDRRFYAGFYTLGVAYWHQIDELLKTVSKGRYDLDRFVLPLLRINYGTHGRPLFLFWKLMGRAGGPKALALSRRYLYTKAPAPRTGPKTEARKPRGNENEQKIKKKAKGNTGQKKRRD